MEKLKIWIDNRIDKEKEISYDNLIKEYLEHEISNQEMPFERKFLLWLGYKNYAVETITDKQWQIIYKTKNNLKTTL